MTQPTEKKRPSILLIVIGAIAACCVIGFVGTAMMGILGKSVATLTPRVESTVPAVSVSINTVAPTQIPTDTPIPSPTVPAFQVYQVGGTVQGEGFTITLNSREFIGDILNANFTVENTGTEEFTVSSIVSFDAKESDGTKLDQTFNCDGGNLDGNILPSDKLRGSICWKGIKTLPIKIYYQSSLFTDNSTIVWEVKQ